jgi:hypothetical protein
MAEMRKGDKLLTRTLAAADVRSQISRPVRMPSGYSHSMPHFPMNFSQGAGSMCEQTNDSR